MGGGNSPSIGANGGGAKEGRSTKLGHKYRSKTRRDRAKGAQKPSASGNAASGRRSITTGGGGKAQGMKPGRRPKRRPSLLRVAKLPFGRRKTGKRRKRRKTAR